MKKIDFLKKAACTVLAGTFLLNVCACTGRGKISDSTVNLMQGIRAESANDNLEPSDEFISGSANFAVELFKQSADKTKNSMISPLSVMLALSMTANGADGETLAQMERVLGGSMDIDTLNKYLGSFTSNLPSSKRAKTSVANSIWMREDGLNVKKEFLETNAKYYNADAYSAPFNQDTLNDINNWVSDKTDGTIDKILDQVPSDAVMYLINALVFDAEWEQIYRKDQIYEGEFNGKNGKQKVSMMNSSESVYLSDGQAMGFVKPYADGYSFAAMLPNENVSIEDYIASMSGDKFIQTIKKATSDDAEFCTVNVNMPKFKAEYSVEMNSALASLGIVDAFDGKADFSGIDSSGNLCISRVVHKTFINVDERGTKAGAATAVEMKETAALETNTVNLDRPFVYAIIENKTNLPIFIGAVMNIE